VEREKESREQREKGQRPWKEFLSDFPLRFTQREREREQTWKGQRHGKEFFYKLVISAM
jgi:hypothetical protein